MDSLPPTTDPGSPVPAESRLDSLATQTAAIDTLIDLAEERLRVFDRDLSEGGWSGARRAQRLNAFLRRSRTARLTIIVHDTRHLESLCPRVLALLKVHSDVMQVWRTGVAASGALDGLVIADETHCLHRYHAEQPRATLYIALPQAAKPLIARFEEIWATGEPALGGSVLGL